MLFLLMISCGKKEIKIDNESEEISAKAPYDTIPVDSFSKGAISVDIARKIKMSSIAYQDSLKEVRKKMEAEKLVQKEKEEKDKIAKKLDEENKKAEELKLKKEKAKSEIEIPAVDNTTKP